MYIPHAVCLRNDVVLIAWTAATDALIAIAYFAIPWMLTTLARRLNVEIDAAPRYIKTLFSVFIFSCGVGHMLDVISIWEPMYFAKAIVNTCTVLASWMAGIVFAKNFSYFAKLISFRYMAMKKLEDIGVRLSPL